MIAARILYVVLKNEIGPRGRPQGHKSRTHQNACRKVVARVIAPLHRWGWRLGLRGRNPADSDPGPLQGAGASVDFSLRPLDRFARWGASVRFPFSHIMRSMIRAAAPPAPLAAPSRCADGLRQQARLACTATQVFLCRFHCRWPRSRCRRCRRRHHSRCAWGR